MLASSLLAALAVAAGTALASLGGAQQASKLMPPTLVISGHGWGHGVGMAQYGTLGYARHGLRYKKILAHYYPGTTLARTSVHQVRVLLAGGARSLTISAKARFRVRDAGGKSYRLRAGSYSIGPSLKLRLRASAAPKALRGPIVFTPGRTPLVLGRGYRGSIQVSSSGGRLRAVDIVGLEDYVRGVVAEEVSPNWPAEALKTQAVASRSYAVATSRQGGYLFADTRSQVYGGVDAETFSTNAAVQATARKILVYRGQPATTYFSASSGGRTAAIQDGFPGSRPVPYLISVPDRYDKLSPYHDWGPYVYSAAAAAKQLGLPGRLLDLRLRRNPSARVASVTATTSTGQRTIPGASFQRALGLRSTWFTVGVLSLARPSKPFVYGVRSELSGIARAVKGARIQQRAKGRWKLVARVKPRSDGSFAVPAKATARTSYRLKKGRAATRPLKVAVAAYVRLDPAASASTLTGRVRPIVRGATVSIQRAAGSTWTKLATAKVDSSGRFRAELQVTSGTYRARFAPNRGLLPGVSPVLQVVSG